MDESRELNAVIDVIMLAGTILLEKWFRDSSGRRYHDSYCAFAGNFGLQCSGYACRYPFFSIENTNISRMNGDFILFL